MKERLVFIVLISFTVIVSACRAHPRRIVVGVAINSSQHPAVELAVREINATGGIQGIPVELLGLDWKEAGNYDAQDILKWANVFSETKELVAVVGHSDSNSTLSAAAFYNQHQIPQIVTIATNPAITNIGGWTYRLCLSDAVQGSALANYAVREWGKKRIAVFYVNDDYGRGLAQLFEKQVQELGGEIIASVMNRNALQKDDQELIWSTIQRIKSAGPPELIALFQRKEAALWIIQAIHQAGLNTDVLGGDSLGASEFLKGPPELTDGVRISQFFVPRPEQALSTKFAHDFKELTHSEPDYGHAFAYDAVYLIRDAVQYGGPSRQGVKTYLDHVIQKRIQRNGVTGPYRLNADHDARRSLFIVKIHSGRQQLVKALSVDE